MSFFGTILESLPACGNTKVQNEQLPKTKDSYMSHNNYMQYITVYSNSLTLYYLKFITLLRIT